MKIFVSYARVDKPYCIRIVETLHAHEIWYDQRLYAGQHWWKEIMRRLDWCDVFIYLLSPDSVNSIYCRKELEVARQLERDIIPVLINAETVIPEDLQEFHYVDMTGTLTVENVTMLLNSILLAERRESPEKRAEMKKLSTSETPIAEMADASQMIRNGAKALQEGDYDNAIVLFKQAKASGFQSRFVNLDKLLQIAEETIHNITRRREAEREYSNILDLFEYESTRGYACETFREFQEEFPDYDPQGLEVRCSQIATRASMENDFMTTALQQEVLPMLQWCDIPFGVVNVSSVESNGEFFSEMTVHVDNYVMSKYPVTNAQFDMFVNAHDGYFNEQWWQFSDYAQQFFAAQSEIPSSKFLGDERPRETVNWYEAIAFCNWLSHNLNMQITLPTVAQWQRAAQGDDDRFYPWGNQYHEDYCNTRESDLKMTTPVNRYDKGVSPYGVQDMSGNVWEWTLDSASATEESPDLRRAVVGGSFVSPCDRAQISFRYYLDPRVRYASIGFRLVGLT